VAQRATPHAQTKPQPPRNETCAHAAACTARADDDDDDEDELEEEDYDPSMITGGVAWCGASAHTPNTCMNVPALTPCLRACACVRARGETALETARRVLDAPPCAPAAAASHAHNALDCPPLSIFRFRACVRVCVFVRSFAGVLELYSFRVLPAQERIVVRLDKPADRCALNSS
jgi:hypothetical protein